VDLRYEKISSILTNQQRCQGLEQIGSYGRLPVSTFKNHFSD